MKTGVSAAMQTHLAQETTNLAKCWKIVRTDGVTYRFTEHDVDLAVPGDGTYLAAVGFMASAMQSKSDMTTDNQNVMGIFDNSAITLDDLRAGLFDYADVYIFFVNWQDLTMGDVKMRRGKLGEVSASPQGWYQAELRGMTQLLQQLIVELYGPTCRADLFDSRCKLVAASYQSTATVTAVTDRKNFTVTLNTAVGTTTDTSWFQYGLATWTAGQNNGRTIDIKSWNPTTGALELFLGTGYPITVGDTLNLLPGCDKTRSTCIAKFNNILNMRAEPDLPGNDQAFNYPDAKG